MTGKLSTRQKATIVRFRDHLALARGTHWDAWVERRDLRRGQRGWLKCVKAAGWTDYAFAPFRG